MKKISYYVIGIMICMSITGFAMYEKIVTPLYEASSDTDTLENNPNKTDLAELLILNNLFLGSKESVSANDVARLLVVKKITGIQSDDLYELIIINNLFGTNNLEDLERLMIVNNMISD